MTARADASGPPDRLARLAAEVRGALGDPAPPPLVLAFALEASCLTAWLVRSDEVVLDSERWALERMLAQRFALAPDTAGAVAAHVLACDEADLPRTAVLLERIGERGVDERRRVIEGLLAVAAADGVLHRKEIALVRRLAEAIELDDGEFQAILQRHDTHGVAAGLRIELDGAPLTVGRTPDNRIQLPSLSVSAHHARFVPDGDGWAVEDLGSRTGTRVNGRLVRRCPLRAEDLVQVENFRFRLDVAAGTLSLWNENDLLALTVEGLSVRVRDRRTGEPRTILDAVSFTCFSGELVAITGPSGSGKTTLIHALLGTFGETAGNVSLNGQDCSDLLERYARRLGLVPQDDIVHGELTVEESLHYSGSLRAVPGVSSHEIRREVDRVIDELALGRIRGERIGDPVRRGVSGGERKRVNLGQELLNPSTELLILDEPTTGLDPHTGVDIFRLLRSLADRGRLILVVTHRVDRQTLDLMDRILVLGGTGRVAYFGPPRRALEACAVDTVPELFDLLRDPSHADRMADRFAAAKRPAPGRAAEADPSDPGAADSAPAGEPAPAPPARPGRRPPSLQRLRQAFREYALHTLRYARIKIRDRVAMAINFGQIPLIVVGCWLVLQNALVTADELPVVPAALPFVLVVAAFWLGCVSAVRELVAERAIHRRERMGGVGVGAYLLSKVTVLAAIVAAQCVLLVGACELLFHLRERRLDLAAAFLTLLLVGMVGVGLGLAASALFRTTEAAVAVLPALVIPQLLFGGVLVPLDQMPSTVHGISYVMASRWGVDGLVQSGSAGHRTGGEKPTSPGCTYFSIPGSLEESHPQPWFLKSLGLAVQRGDRPAQPLFTFPQVLAALAALAAGGAGLAYLLLRRKPWGRTG